MPALSIIVIGFLTLSLSAGLTIALLPLGILQRQGWFPASPEISLWLLLLTCGLFGLVLLGLKSEDRLRRRLTATTGTALLMIGVLLGIEILLIQARPPVAPGRISLWALFIGCAALGVIAVSAAEKARRMERHAEEEMALEIERQAQAACAEERLRTSLRFGRRSIRRS